MNIPHDALKKNIRNLVCEAFKGDALAKNPPKKSIFLFLQINIILCIYNDCAKFHNDILLTIATITA